MKSLDMNELVSFCEWLGEELASAQLQDVWTDGKVLVLQFYRLKDLFFVINLNPTTPMVWLQLHRPQVLKRPKPVTLFMNAHARNLIFKGVGVITEKGRSLFVTLGNRQNSCEIEIDLIPKSPNLMVSAGEKSIFWNKPKNLPAPKFAVEEIEARDWKLWCEEAAQFNFNRKIESKKSQTSGASPLRDLEKKQKALEVISSQLHSSESERLQELGELLKTSEEVPAHLKELYDPRQSRAQNRERLFQRAKDLKRKKEGTALRIEVLKGEIAKLQAQVERGETSALKTPSLANRAMQKAEAKGRKLVFEDGLEAVLGKSGADNLAILRQARGWDFWIHLKDEPSAHAILFRNRQQEVPDSVIQKVAQWVWQESKGKKPPPLRFEVLVVECRYVKPIRGDRLGRVNYQNPRVYSFASKATT